MLDIVLVNLNVLQVIEKRTYDLLLITLEEEGVKHYFDFE